MDFVVIKDIFISGSLLILRDFTTKIYELFEIHSKSIINLRHIRFN